MFSKNIIACTFLLFLIHPVFSQQTKKYIDAANDYFVSGDYYNASLNYQKVFEQSDSSNIELLNNYAECAKNILDYKLAEILYQKTLNIDKKNQYPESLFWLAMMKKSNGKYKGAQKLFTKYFKKYKKKKSYYVKKAEQEIKSCEFANLHRINSPNNAVIIQLDSSINSLDADFAALQLNDSAFFFSSTKSNSVDQLASIHAFSYKDSSSTILPIKREALEHIGNIAFSTNKKHLYFTKCLNTKQNEVQCAIYTCKYEDNKCTSIEKLNDQINLANYTNTHPSIGFIDSIGEVLFFTSNRSGGEGKMDLWACTIDSNLNFGKPYNLGKTINTLDNEVTPFYCNKCQALYFSSDWHQGFGGYDIFHSYHQQGKYSLPENLGYPINSSYNDIYFTANQHNSNAYFSSNRIGSFHRTNENCCNDIYKIEFPSITSQNDSSEKQKPLDTVEVIKNKIKLLVPLTLYFHNDEPDKKTTLTTTTKNYQKTCEDYLALLEEYKQEYSRGLKGEKKEQAILDIETLFEDSVDAGMENLDLFTSLLLKLLEKGENTQITMKGYCSPLASTDYNINLAKRRISSLKNYFNEYKDGVLKKYILEIDSSKTQLKLLEEDIGELKARPNVSDNPNDVKNSVYSPIAAIERKIQIIAISFDIK